MRTFEIAYAVGNEAFKALVRAEGVTVYRNNDGVFTDITFKNVENNRYIVFAPHSVKAISERV